MVEQVGERTKFKLIKQFKDSGVQPFSLFMRERANFSNVIQTGEMIKLVRQIQVHCFYMYDMHACNTFIIRVLMLQIYCPAGLKTTHQQSQTNDAMDKISRYVHV